MARLVFILKYVPGLAFVFFRFALPVWNFVLSNIYALWYIRDRRSAVRRLRDLRETVDGNPAELACWYSVVGFRWVADYWNGMLDFSQKPWVSVAKRTGDCDDMMTLAYYVLRRSHYRLHKGYTYSNDGCGHALLVLVDKASGAVSVMDNMRFVGVFDSIDDAMTSYYGVNTYYYYVV